MRGRPFGSSGRNKIYVRPIPTIVGSVDVGKLPNAEPPIYPNGDRVAAIEQFVPNFSAPVFAPPVIAAALAELCKRRPRNEIDKFSAQGIALNKFRFAYVSTTADGRKAIKLAGFSRLHLQSAKRTPFIRSRLRSASSGDVMYSFRLP
jgi:hypothetical protein